MVTRVRRRVVAALVLATVSAVLWVTAAAADSSPQSAFFWIITAGVGIASLLAIAMIESYRSRSGRVMSRIDQLMEGWE